MVRKGGLEPPRPCDHKILNLARLPIPPLSHALGHTSIPGPGVKISAPVSMGLRSGVPMEESDT